MSKAQSKPEGVTPSQTVGPYFAYGLTSNGKYDWNDAFTNNLVTQMYFPGDPLFPFDPIFNSVTDEKARNRMVSSFDLDNTKPDWALCYRFDIVLGGQFATPMEP